MVPYDMENYPQWKSRERSKLQQYKEFSNKFFQEKILPMRKFQLPT